MQNLYTYNSSMRKNRVFFCSLYILNSNTAIYFNSLCLLWTPTKQESQLIYGSMRCHAISNSLMLATHSLGFPLIVYSVLLFCPCSSLCPWIHSRTPSIYDNIGIKMQPYIVEWSNKTCRKHTHIHTHPLNRVDDDIKIQYIKKKLYLHIKKPNTQQRNTKPT